MRLVLASHSVAYGLWAKISAVQSGAGRSCRGLNIQVPKSADEAANANVVVKIGPPNAGATDVPSPDVILDEGESYLYPTSNVNDISLVSKSIIASLDNAVVVVNPEYA